MPDIHHHFIIKATPEKVFRGISTPEGLDVWWTKSSSGKPVTGDEYELGFGPGYDWHGVVTRCVQDSEFEWQLRNSDKDWDGTRVGFQLEMKDGVTQVRFHHLGWPEDNDHYRISSYCWAMYLRLLKRHVEHGEVVPYEKRLDI